MRLEKVRIKGFRNFDDTEVIFQKKTLIIGANDVGKSNLLYALRILFDKTISEHDLELTESDYNAYSGTDTIEITASMRSNRRLLVKYIWKCRQRWKSGYKIYESKKWYI